MVGPAPQQQTLARDTSSVVLSAKKKNKLFSDDFLSQFDDYAGDGDGDADSPSKGDNTTEGGSVAVATKKKKKDKKDKNKAGISDDLLASIDESLNAVEADEVEEKVEQVDDDVSPTMSNKKKKAKKKKEEKAAAASAVAEIKENVDVESDVQVPADVDDVAESAKDGLTAEQRMRKERPPARVRFAESSQPDFVMMALEKVGLVFGNQVVLKDASFGVTTGERVGLVGPNGGGKTTSLRILAGELEPTTGEIVKSSKKLRVSFLRQEFVDGLDKERSLRDELFTAFEEERALIKEIETVEEEVSRAVDDADTMAKVLDKLQGLQEKAIAMGVYALGPKVEKMMESMGFSAADADSKVGSFSGGWKMRIGLAKILLQDPNILLLDEPTNHLDLDSVYWLEDFLVKQNIPMVIVSHDREFLDKVCNKIVDVEDGVTVPYKGNYSKFLDQKRTRLNLWRENYDKQQKFVKEEEKWLKKAKNDPNMAQQVRAKEIALEKYKSADDFLEPPPKDRKFRFRFPPAPRCGQNVLVAEKLGHGYGAGENSMLFKDVEMQVDRGERIGFVGPNGAGKSTMMRVIHGKETPKEGFAELGSMAVVTNYYEQSQADALDLDKSVFETVMEVAPSEMSYTDVRSLLGQFMFKGDEVEKKLRVLSGGEKARVALCRMMMEPCNLLLLDEPTNHLDITSKEVLEEALQHFEGSVLLISHDRYFMSKVANRIFSFEDGTVKRYDSDYHDFINGKDDDSLKDKVFSRRVEGDRYFITNHNPMVEQEEKSKKKKNFGGSGVTGGNLNKGIKNAKRYANK
jgi:ATPase subunit of ABC transporter with duplicated ATPase domains